MKLLKANAKAVQYAIKKWHYSKKVPLVQLAYAVFNEYDEFCGVICYSIGANKSIASPYNLRQGEVVELVRVALNGQQQYTSKAIALSLKLLKKDAPLVKIVVSYADSLQNHIGIIYQASNWFFEKVCRSDADILFNNKITHARTINNIRGTTVGLTKVKEVGVKYKYVYPLTKGMRAYCKKICKPYPKKQNLTSE